MVVDEIEKHILRLTQANRPILNLAIIYALTLRVGAERGPR